MPTDAEETLDGVLGGALQVVQRRRGYRFSLDALLLADFVSPAIGQVVDLGTGCGVIALAIAYRSPEAQVTAVEIQEGLASRAQRAVALNRLEGRVSIVRGDLRKLEGVLEAGAFDRVVSNPPYQPVDAGRRNPDSERAIARHELEAAVADVVRSARRLLKPTGRLALVFPARRQAALVQALQLEGLRTLRQRDVVPREGQPPELLLIEAGLQERSGAEPEVLPALVLHAEGRDYTPEAARILGEPPRPRI